jgi:hypothetical protein
VCLLSITKLTDLVALCNLLHKGYYLMTCCRVYIRWNVSVCFSGRLLSGMQGHSRGFGEIPLKADTIALSRTKRHIPRPEVGSSRNNILDPVISWLATLTRLFCPPLKPFLIGVPMMELDWFRKPKESIMVSIRLLRSLRVNELFSLQQGQII